MTALQLVREECANYQPDGSCLGAVINDDLSITRCHPKPRCLVADGKRCPYFEEYVAPMVNMVTVPRRAAEIQEAVAEYRQITNQKAPRSRPCPECGQAVQKGKQLCPTCAHKSRKASNRAAQARHRQETDGMSAEVPKNDANSFGKSCVSDPVS